MGALVWLASYPKSGNTWMRAFLHNLFINPAEPLPPDTLIRFTVSDTHKTWYRAVADGRSVDGLTDKDLAELRPKAQARMTQAHPDSVFVKTHAANLEQSGVPMISPDVTAGAIYIIRDPRDVVISMTHHYGVSLDEAIIRMGNDVGGTAESDVNIAQLISSWSLNVSSWTAAPNPQLHVVRYEDMLDKAFATFGGIARFLGLDVPKDRLQKAIKFSSFNALKSLEQKHGFQERSEHAERFFREGRKEQWKKILSPEQAKAIETRHGEQMRRFGYL
jgi:hypothetical protein